MKILIVVGILNFLVLGSYLLNTRQVSPDTLVLASASDPVLLAAKCREYRERYPDRKLPNACQTAGTPTVVPTSLPGITATIGPTSIGGTRPSPTPITSIAPQPGQPYADAPLCPASAHDKRKFHSLWNADLGCHYDHHHGDNPHDADVVLGTDIYSKMGGEISYPWQTFSTSGLENDLKHAGYFWHVRKDIPCPNNNPCITAFRTLVHQHPSGMDATVRYHSYAFEAQMSDGGYILTGGWVDFGDLHSPEGTVITDVHGNHDSRLGGGAGRHKQHSPTNGQIIWYGASQIRVDENYPRGFITLSSTIQDAWDITDPNDPSRHDDYVCHGLVPAGRCRTNATTLRPHLISVNMSVRDFNSIIDADSNGSADFQGYADRYGRPLAPGHSCTAYTVDCAPMIMRSLKTGYNYPTADSHTALSFKDYDIYFGNQSAGWNQPVP